jgi:uncharacterized protein
MDVAAHGLADVAASAPFLAVSREIRRGVEACRRDCRYFRWCGGGAAANKLFETERFDTAETMHCRLTRQVVLDEVIAGMEAHMRPANMRHAYAGPS